MKKRRAIDKYGHRLQQRRFVCPVCGAQQDMPKWKQTRTCGGHVKTAWCFRCQAMRDLVQVDEQKEWSGSEDG